MKGKAGIVVGLAVGYVLGSRAGRERYEQIKTQWLKVWNTPPVQKQLDNAKELAKTAALALPSTVWDGAVKVVKAATSSKGTPGASAISNNSRSDRDDWVPSICDESTASRRT